MRKLIILAALGVAAVTPTSAGAATCTTVRTTLSSVQSGVTSAMPGDVICLADGTYGKLTLSATKAAPGVTVQSEHPGLSTVAGASLDGARLTLSQFRISGDEVTVMPGSTGMTISHNLITGGYFGIDAGPTSSTQVNDVSITGNRFQGPFGEDAIRANRYHDADGDGKGLLVEGNEFTNVRENGNHSDCLQAVWVGDHMIFRRNYLHDNRCQGFFIKDQASTVTNVVAEDNLMLRNDAPCGPPATSCGQPSIFQLFGPMKDLTVRRNTIWTPGGQSPTTLRDPGWTGVRLFDSNVIYRAWTDTCSPFGTGYSATNNVSNHPPENAPGGCWPSAGFATVASPAFADPAHDDYRTNDGRGVTWAPADQVYGPETAVTPPDTTPPETTITEGPVDSTSTSAIVAFTSNEPGIFECALDGDPYATCSSPQNLAGLTVGSHAYRVRATDTAGNVDPTPATVTWTVTAPPPSCEEQLAALQADLDAMTVSRDAWKARAEAAEAKLAQIHDLSAP